ncbi:MAG: hypothetical protein RJB66_1436 [Pseudomonadota bacterium]|jgi:hypothetical protein
MPYFKSLFVYSALLLVPAMASAYLTNADSGELVPIDQYRLVIEPQVSHFNLTAHFDTGISDSSQMRVSLGSGEDGTHLDFFYKNIPVPDYGNQPAIGYKVGTIFASDRGTNIFTVRFMPLISKSYEINQNRWTPYLSLPLSVSTVKSTSTTPIHAVIGTEVTLESAPDMQLGCEIGANIKDSFSYGSVFISFYFEPPENVTETRNH